MRQGEAVFVDSGAWIALALSRDPLHGEGPGGASIMPVVLPLLTKPVSIVAGRSIGEKPAWHNRKPTISV